jgi:copper homeostasis protein CutC
MTARSGRAPRARCRAATRPGSQHVVASSRPSSCTRPRQLRGCGDGQAAVAARDDAHAVAEAGQDGVEVVLGAVVADDDLDGERLRQRRLQRLSDRAAAL